MKKSAFYFLLTLFLIGIFFKISSYSKASFENAPESVSLPYVIEEKDWQGDLISEKKGVSSGEDETEVAESLGYTLYPEDKLSAFPEMKMNIGSKITITRAPVIYLKDGKKRFEFRSWKKTVGELLEEKNIELGEDDKINFSTDTFLEDEMQLVIVRVAITTVNEKEQIDYKTIKKDDPNLDEGKTKVAQAGVKGEKLLTYRVMRENGEEVSRSLVNTEIVSEPKEEVLMIGTRPVITVRCKFNDTVISAAQKYGADANALCTLMMKESNGNPRSGEGTQYQGLFQYTDGFWKIASTKAGYAGASIFDPTAQIFSTAWAVTHGERGRWP